MPSNKHLERVLDAIPAGVTIIDRDGRIIFANDAATKIFKAKRSDIIGRHFSDFEWRVVTKNGKRITFEEHPFVKLLQTGAPVYEFEHVHEYPEGIQRIMLANAEPLYDEKGVLIGAVISHSDITAQKQAAEEIRESRRQVLDILESITDGFFALDNDWRFTYLNRKAEQLLGKRKELLLFRNIWEVLPDVVGTKSYEELNRAKEDMAPISFEAFYPSLNRWLETHIYPYKNGLSVYLSDITARKRVEDTLKKSESRYHILFDESPASLWEEDASDVKAYFDSLSNRGVKNFRTYFESHPEDIAKLAAMIKIVDVNKATLELYKASSKEEFKKNLSVFFGKESFDAFKEAIITLAEGKTEFESETVNRTLTGGIINIVLKIFVAPGHEETLSKLLISIVDITERKREKELSDALNNINRTINSRLDFDAIMGCVVVDAAKAIGSERAGIVLREDNFWITRYGYNLPPEVFGSKLTEEEARATTLAAKTKTTVAVNDTYRDERVNRAVMERYGIRSLLAAPLVVRGNTIGVIAFSYHSAPVGFTESQVDFVSKLAATVSIAIDNARLVDELKKSVKELEKKSKG